LFPDPDLKERVAYCHFWQKKLSGNDDIEFPDKLCQAIAEITDGFSFAYIQEAFVAALLIIARKTGTDEPDADLWCVVEDAEDDWVGVATDAVHVDDPDLQKLVLWVEIQKQIQILRNGMDRTV
jgi:transitional endoplasmic reticulum ATPase